MSGVIILWMLDVEYLPPVRAPTPLRNHKKPASPVGFFTSVPPLLPGQLLSHSR
ncbi:hypothetical protein EC970259_A0024 [Escherichia coli 99.0741]|nr:hypothetical protein EC970259_A0024 [Escherichia coli 99.0741]